MMHAGVSDLPRTLDRWSFKESGARMLRATSARPVFALASGSKGAVDFDRSCDARAISPIAAPKRTVSFGQRLRGGRSSSAGPDGDSCLSPSRGAIRETKGR
jgi:hypothetical protein